MDLSNTETTALLRRWSAGDRTVEDEVMAVIYPLLRALANRQLARDGAMTLQPTELAHEAYLQLANQRTRWQNRGHFFAIAGRVVRRVVIDHLRERSAAKRGGREPALAVDHLIEAELPAIDCAVDWLDVDRALTELEAIQPHSARLIELRYFAGLSLEDTAAAMGMSRATIVRQWRTARAWLHERMHGRI
jgi:RNA polymerase sigma factor (TIGR02999 family)